MHQLGAKLPRIGASLQAVRPGKAFAEVIEELRSFCWRAFRGEALLRAWGGGPLQALSWVGGYRL